MKLQHQLAGLNFFLLFFLLDFLVFYSLCLLQFIVISFTEQWQTSACPWSAVTVRLSPAAVQLCSLSSSAVPAEPAPHGQACSCSPCEPHSVVCLSQETYFSVKIYCVLYLHL